MTSEVQETARRAGLERIKDLSSSCDSLRDLERISVLHQRALKASKDLQAVEVLTYGQLKFPEVKHCLS